MTFAEWLADSRRRYRDEGIHGLVNSSYELYVGALRRIGRVYNPGESIFDREWEVLLVLDACRYDLMTDVAGEYDFIDTVETSNSIGSDSRSWMNRNFRDDFTEEMAKTAYICGNPFSDECLDSTNFHVLDEVWRYAWDETLGTIRARPLTDRAVHAWSAASPARMIVHYMQPHHPFVQDPDIYGKLDPDTFGEADEPMFWDLVETGHIDIGIAREAYRENLRYVLDEVAFLLQTIDAERVVITADHGNAFGEYGVYGHPGDVPLSVLRRVPWVETRAERITDFDPELRPHRLDEDVETRLEDLGYK